MDRRECMRRATGAEPDGDPRLHRGRGSDPIPDADARRGHGGSGSPAAQDDPSSSAASIPDPESLDAESVIDCYELACLPAPPRTGRAEPAANLLALIDRYDAFILDGYGVINVGAEPIPGIGDTIRALRAAGRDVMVLTNGSGRPSRQTARRYERWGLDIPRRLVVTSRDALEASLAAHPRAGLWGVMAQPDSELETLPVETVLLEDDEAPYRHANGFIFIRSEGWSTARHRLLADALCESPRPVLVANPDVSAPYPDGHLSAEPGYWALRIEAETGVRCERFGKPFSPAFELALSRLGRAAAGRERVAMVGDGLHTDILGGLAAGLGTILVTDHGLLRGLDWEARAARAGIVPDHVIPEA